MDPLPFVPPDPAADAVALWCLRAFLASIAVFVVGSLILRWRQVRREVRDD